MQHQADAQSPTTGKSNFEVLDLRMGHAEEDLREIREEFRSIAGQLRELRSIVLEKKPQWKELAIAIASVMTVLVMITGYIWGMAIDPIRSDIKDIKATLGQIVPREFHVEKWAEQDKRFSQIESIIADLKKDKLDRIDVESLKAQLSAKIDELNSRLNPATRRH